MQHVISLENTHLSKQSTYSHKENVIIQFLAWCNGQEKNRFVWLSIALVVGIGTILPLTLFAIMVGANSNFILWVITCVVNVPILVLNLAVQPTKAILPALFFAWFIDAIVIAYCAALFFQNL